MKKKKEKKEKRPGPQLYNTCQADMQHTQRSARLSWLCQSRARNVLAIVGSLTCKLQAGSAAEDGPPCVEGRALVYPGVLVLVQVANDQAAPRHVTPVVIPQINERSV